MQAVLVVHRDREHANDLAEEAASWLIAHGHTAVLPPEDAKCVGLDELAAPDSESISGADLAVCIGGDGTMLRTVELVSAYGVPIIGINVGRLGYLSEVEPAGLIDAFKRFFSGAYRIEERMMLEVVIESNLVAAGPYRALNEVVIEKTQAGHTVRLAVSIAGTPFTSYAADGLIVATPTGSTAYSLSARGPILSPRAEALVLTPVSPHMLFDRAMVLAPDEDLTFEVLGDRQATVTVDGRSLGVLAMGDLLSCRRAHPSARFVRFGERSFHQVLKAKFGLADR
jgi:NAD+ kinase